MSSPVRSAIQTQFRTIDALQIRFAESGQRDDHALLLSPWPDSLYAFDQMWDRLAERTHLVAVDLPAFGTAWRGTSPTVHNHGDRGAQAWRSSAHQLRRLR
jgi:hypothetical protein